MAYTEVDLEAIKQLRLGGVSSTTLSNGRKVEYNDPRVLRELQQEIQADLDEASGEETGAYYVGTSKGT